MRYYTNASLGIIIIDSTVNTQILSLLADTRYALCTPLLQGNKSKSQYRCSYTVYITWNCEECTL